MRPLRLELEGFTSFRERTEVSFEDTDLFVFTGATGSGKSSLIDAMIFALYGSVPRLDKRNLIEPVISQGKLQAKVRLDFEAGAKLYTAVRVVERAKAGAKTKAATLEERRSNGPARILANTGPELLQCVKTDVIGLDLDHFTKCVVLPQGEFAAFLRDKPGDREEMLKRLLGLGLYEKLRKAAFQRWSDAQQKVGSLQLLLESVAGATPEAVRGARNRAAVLDELKKHIDEVGSDLVKLRSAAEAAGAQWTQAARQLELLAEVRLPEGMAELASRYRQAEERLREASEAGEVAATRLSTAQSARAQLPERAAIEKIVEKRQDLARRMAEVEEARGRLNEVAEATGRAKRREKSICKALADAEASLERLPSRAALEGIRDDRRRHLELEHEAARTRQELGEVEWMLQNGKDRERSVGADLARMKDKLKALPTKEKLEGIREERRQLRQREREAARTRGKLGEAEQMLLDAKDRERLVVDELVREKNHLTDLPATGELKGIRRQWEELVQAEHEAQGTRLELARAEEKYGISERRKTGADQRLKTATEDWEAQRMAHSAADLARHLEEGAQCPVCHQTVGSLPEHDAPADLEAAHKAKDDAATACDEARADLQLWASRRDQCVARLEQQGKSAAGLREALAGKPAEDKIGVLLAEIDETEEQVRKLERDSENVARHRRQCELERNNYAEALRQLERFVRSQREALAGKPTDDGIGVLLAEIGEVEERVGCLRARLDNVNEEVAKFAGKLAAVGAKLEVEERSARSLLEDLAGKPTDDEIDALLADISRGEEEVRLLDKRVKEAESARAERERQLHVASATLDQQKKFAAGLRAELANAPTPEEASAQLERISVTDELLLRAQEDQESAHRIHQEAAQALESYKERINAAWSEFYATRDRVAEMQPPVSIVDNLSQSWTLLSQWAEDTYAATEDVLACLDAEENRASAKRKRLDFELQERCRADGLSLEDSDNPANNCAMALGAAHKEMDVLLQDAATRMKAAAEAKEASKLATVAKGLHRHLDAKNFGAWLQNQILAWLVQGAAVRLRELSSGQYSLDLSDKNEFLVIDHRNADEPRLAKTLSGGETFLASLALALSLAEQVANLAAHGSAKLEALFLDEGFGTLDSETLEVVAATIEQLGTERMVGIVTHVPELADRIPVQYRVKKVGNSSSVERVEV